MSGGRPAQSLVPWGRRGASLEVYRCLEEISALPSFLLEQRVGFCFGALIPCSSVTSPSHFLFL